VNKAWPCGTDIQSEYDIRDSAGAELLTQACLSADRAASLAAIIARDGETIETKIGMKEHPLLKSELGARSFVVRCIEKLGLTLEPIGRIGRPGGGWRG